MGLLNGVWFGTKLCGFPGGLSIQKRWTAKSAKDARTTDNFLITAGRHYTRKTTSSARSTLPCYFASLAVNAWTVETGNDG